MWPRDKIFRKYCNSKQAMVKEYLHTNSENLRNLVIYLIRKLKTHLYEIFFENDKNFTAMIWKGIKQLIS